MLASEEAFCHLDELTRYDLADQLLMIGGYTTNQIVCGAIATSDGGKGEGISPVHGSDVSLPESPDQWVGRAAASG